MTRSSLPREVNLLKTREVADMFGVDPKTVNRWAIKGLIPRIKIEKQARYHLQVVKDIIAAGGVVE